MARNAVRRVARTVEFTDEDLAELRIIATELDKLLRHWTFVVEAKQHELLRQKLLATA